MQTQRQISAGGVIIRATPDGPETCLLTRRGQRGERIMCLPKGKVEPQEPVDRTALREVREETGLSGRILRKLGRIHYWYTLKAQDVRYNKTVHFYLMQYENGSTADHDAEADEAQWYPLTEAIRLSSYPSERHILRKAQTALAAHHNS